MARRQGVRDRRDVVREAPVLVLRVHIGRTFFGIDGCLRAQLVTDLSQHVAFTQHRSDGDVVRVTGVIAPIGRTRETVFVNVEPVGAGLSSDAAVGTRQVILPSGDAGTDMKTGRKIGVRFARGPQHLPRLAVGLAQVRLRVDKYSLDVEPDRNLQRLHVADGPAKRVDATQVLPRLIVTAAAVHWIPAPIEQMQVVDSAKRFRIRLHDLL